MASLKSQLTYEAILKSEILTELELEENPILITLCNTTYDERIAIKTTQLFKMPWSKMRKKLLITNR